VDEKSAQAHMLLGRIHLIKREYEKAINEGKRYVTLNPNYDMGYTQLARTMLYSGQFDESITLMKKALRLNPKSPPMLLTVLVRSYLQSERYEEVVEVANQMAEHARNGNLPSWVPLLAFAIAHQGLGREEEARAYTAEALEIKPDLSLEYFKTISHYKNPAHLQRELDARRKAGMPEKPPGAVQ
jgi:tetratricopeptide (TPR) repeat protein